MKPRARAPAELIVLVGEDTAVLSFVLDERSEATLTVAESEIVVQLLAGHSNAQIARSRRRSTRTIANQVASILRKLGVGSRFELAVRMPTMRTVR